MSIMTVVVIITQVEAVVITHIAVVAIAHTAVTVGAAVTVGEAVIVVAAVTVAAVTQSKTISTLVAVTQEQPSRKSRTRTNWGRAHESSK
jgi:hypothetical protein